MQRLLITMLALAPLTSTAWAEEPRQDMNRQVEMARSEDQTGADQKRALSREEMDQVTAGAEIVLPVGVPILSGIGLGGDPINANLGAVADY